jgi:hypothetical protein
MVNELSPRRSAAAGQRRKPCATESETRRRLALHVLCLGMLMIVLDATIVNVALPSVKADPAILLGRATYEGFAEAWASRTDEFSQRMIGLSKYVASTTLKETKWNATLIDRDVADEVATLKQQPGETILKYGTGELDRTLMAHKLVASSTSGTTPSPSGPVSDSSTDSTPPPGAPRLDAVQVGHRRARLRPQLAAAHATPGRR